jgi:hypothetical protein
MHPTTSAERPWLSLSDNQPNLQYLHEELYLAWAWPKVAAQACPVGGSTQQQQEAAAGAKVPLGAGAYWVAAAPAATVVAQAAVALLLLLLRQGLQGNGPHGIDPWEGRRSSRQGQTVSVLLCGVVNDRCLTGTNAARAVWHAAGGSITGNVHCKRVQHLNGTLLDVSFCVTLSRCRHQLAACRCNAWPPCALCTHLPPCIG